MESLTKPSTANNSVLKVIFTVVFVGFPFLGFYLGMQYQSSTTEPANETVQVPTTLIHKSTPTQTASQVPTGTLAISQVPTGTLAGWKTYTNTKHNYSVEYPSSWTFREFPNTKDGAGLRPLEKPNDIKYEVINVNFSKRGLDAQKIPFEDYVKKAAVEEIQNYQSLAGIEKVITQTGLVGYKTTWNVTSLTGKTAISSPITYFDTKDMVGDTIQISLSDNTYLSIYNQILSTFKFLQ